VRGLSGVQKGFTVISAEGPNAPALFLVNAHTHPTDEPTRIAQMLQLVATLYSHPTYGERPVLFTADLNATPKGPEYAILRDLLLFRDAYAEAHGGYGKECTYCANNPYSWSREDRVIDYTLYRPGPKQSLRAASSKINLTGEGQPYSDHFGVRTELAWEERTDEPLALDSLAFETRRQAALNTLAELRGKLAGETNPAIVEAARWAADFSDRLANGRLTTPEAKVFLTP